MNQASTRKKFIFNSHVDEDWLYSMYEDDYSYIIEVLNNSLDTIREELPSFTAAYELHDLDALKRSAHKLKPIFGFSGLLNHQEKVAHFENACTSASNTDNLTLQYIEVLDAMKEGKAIIQEEYNRLTAFTS